MTCLCRCGESPYLPTSRFVRGHDGYLHSKLLNAVGGYEALRALVEGHIGRKVNDDDLLR